MRTPDHGEELGEPTVLARPTLSSGEFGDLQALIEAVSAPEGAAKNNPVAVRAELETAEQRSYERSPLSRIIPRCSLSPGTPPLPTRAKRSM